MCGIIGILGNNPVAPSLVEALKRLEYRGYDSAGIATLVNGHIDRRRAPGKLGNLENLLKQEPLSGTLGIGHTRWATHGRPAEHNAHPHATDKVAIVHNGIIENFHELRRELESEGAHFQSETDSETIAHLLTAHLRAGMNPTEAFAATLKRLEGAFALAAVFAGHKDLLMGARRGSPLAVGYGDTATGEMYLGSDALALAPLTQKITYLEDGDWVVLQKGQAQIFDAAGHAVNRAVKLTQLSGAMIGKAQYRHFMLKEIFEQATVLGDTLNSYLSPEDGRLSLPSMPFDWAKISKITILGCGTAYYAGFVAKYWFEQIARLPVEIDIASEFRYRAAPMAKDGVTLVISQSGETADTLAALHYAKAQGQTVLGIVNAPESSMARAVDVGLPTHAGPEIGVASTKAFTTQLAVLACLTLSAATARGTLSKEEAAKLHQALLETPAQITEILQKDDAIRAMADEIAAARDVLYLGRGTAYPLALEGALKLKEISYIHAEGFAAGELKHGPIALIDEKVPVVVLAPQDSLYEKTASNLQEVIARGGQVYVFAEPAALQKLPKPAGSFAMPLCHPFVAPILYAVPIQLLAYYAAMAKGTDIDQPRNLAKSVTVE